ncbi:MAG: sulfite exporter TauE/SafE family protein [Clostridioides sp.]|jgi:uncharacterized membrane protein YfcA|nr:sulfite exporter TauE/SafE family protein [Clostridioides sp.]
MIVNVVRGLFILLAAVYGVVFGKDFMHAKKEGKLETEVSTGKTLCTGLITDFADTLGIGSFAPTVALIKFLKLDIHDRHIPGVLNVGHTIPVILEALVFTLAIDVDAVTLAVLIGSAVVGSYVGAGIISKLDDKKIQLIMGVALAITAVVMFLAHPWINLMPGGGEATALTGTALIIGAIGNFILGALMTAGIGLYAPCMAMVYFLGMSPAVAFPIMMGSCAMLMPVASTKFIKEGAYNKKASICITLGGIVGVLAAVFLFKNLPMDILKMLVVLVIIYTSITMLMSAKKKSVE